MKNILLIPFLLALMTSCSKDFLEVKPDKKLVVPATLDDLEAVLDYSDRMNRSLSSMGDVQADDYFWNYAGWSSSSTAYFKNGYIWNKTIYDAGSSGPDWTSSYQMAFQANVALEGLEKLEKGYSIDRYNKIKGRALFFRAFAHFLVAQVYCAPFDKTKDNSEVGIPLRLTADINTPSRRQTVKETYDQILSDLLAAEVLMPQTEAIKTRPSKSAVQALLSRVYLAMQDYEFALKYADQVIQSQKYPLIDFNSINLSATYPMEKFNQEVIFHSLQTSAGPISSTQINIDTTLYTSYGSADLRKNAWFRMQSGKLRFRGSYDGSTQYFNGLAVDECYLTKAECLIRLGDYKTGIKILDSFLTTRHSVYSPIIVNSEAEALKITLWERRKELLLRGVRWTDLRRLNLANRTQKTLYRNLDGSLYTLLPNSPNYILPIPPNVVELTNMSQNERE
ncbi:RagB/SusD family nutrient uptake outer membrane protein [Sphingobacterium mizutaii]|uniref:RagB/SusD family nutrient uptake outer membrane protein n=1 Tax=Sphingobacterium mizutaii TaxID=1010 RepID=UPI001627E7E9|nr:RagB/SusD family nutrient uptake outer membrane protein [Sphingobacterium mizutaii]